MSRRKRARARAEADNEYQRGHNKRSETHTVSVNTRRKTVYTVQGGEAIVATNQTQGIRKKVELRPKSVNQEKYILSLLDEDIDVVVVSGPAGTGKTYLAVLAAIQAYRDGLCDRIILARPKVAVDDEDHGFLPGDLNQKMEPWVKPLLDIFAEFYSKKELEYLVSSGAVEIVPLGFCRGRTFKNSWIIVDESQNALPSMLKMILTRIGEGSKLVIGGDVEQADRKTPENGLLDLVTRLEQHQVPGIATCKFDVKDVRRHRIIEHVLKLYQ